MPRVLLLDEPLSNLDARLRLQTREEIRRIQRETGVTTVFVTHDQEEAMSISDVIVVMKDGVLQITFNLDRNEIISNNHCGFGGCAVVCCNKDTYDKQAGSCGQQCRCRHQQHYDANKHPFIYR